MVDIVKLTGGAWEPWPDDKLEAYEHYCVRHNLSTAQTIYELCVGTGQRIGDCINMMWDDFDGEFMDVMQEKTKTKMSLYRPARLQAYLATLPRAGRHILAKNLTQLIGKRAAQKAVEDVRTALAIMHTARTGGSPMGGATRRLCNSPTPDAATTRCRPSRVTRQWRWSESIAPGVTKRPHPSALKNEGIGSTEHKRNKNLRNLPRNLQQQTCKGTKICRKLSMKSKWCG